MWNLFRGRVKARQNEEFIRMETRKCMLRPNSFSLFSHFINCFLHESLNQRPKSSRFSATKCIVLSRTLSSAFSYSCTHTCVCHYYFYRKCHGVNFFLPILRLFDLFPPRSELLLFWFWHFSSRIEVKCNKKKDSLTGTRCAQAKTIDSKRRSKKMDWTLLSHSNHSTRNANNFSLPKLFFSIFFSGAASCQIILI